MGAAGGDPGDVGRIVAGESKAGLHQRGSLGEELHGVGGGNHVSIREGTGHGLAPDDDRLATGLAVGHVLAEEIADLVGIAAAPPTAAALLRKLRRESCFSVISISCLIELCTLIHCCFNSITVVLKNA